MEVSQVLSSLPGVEEANVYGVQAGISGSQGWWLHSNLQKGKKKWIPTKWWSITVIFFLFGVAVIEESGKYSVSQC